MQGATDKLVRVLTSRRFFYATLLFFAIEGLWIALSAVYPMAFDEDFHFGLIQIYSHHWLPFLSEQPAGANAYGAVATDPSYLYHYLLSFPYRIVAFVTDGQAAQVIVLRCINIGIFASSIWLFRKIMLRAGTSPALVHAAILLFVLIPIVPLMAGQINYDSLFMLLLAAMCWLVYSLMERLRAKKMDVVLVGAFIAVCMLACLVKYAFLPLALAASLCLLLVGWRTWKGGGAQLRAAIGQSYAGLSGAAKISLIAVLVVSGGLFMQRYGLNAIKYGNPVPPCESVIGAESCMAYGPWARNFRYAADKQEASHSPFVFAWLWLQGMHYRTFFMITGPPTHINYPPSPLPSGAAIVITLFGCAAVGFYWRRVFAGRPFLAVLLIMSAVYIGFLWFDTYSQYLETGRPVAINGRYLIPLLLPLIAVLGRGLSVAFYNWPRLKAWTAVGAIVLFLHGGGVLGFISRSDASWYWPNQAVRNVNDAARQVINPLIFEGAKHYEHHQ